MGGGGKPVAIQSRAVWWKRKSGKWVQITAVVIKGMIK
jgi:hypothetical protein